ncbi:hypothetical protein ACFCXF_05850 [Streptomyces virginiae]|uniref:hypothetical protein n=1 Tax=Streptomyces virginiae TaxID=1961 RepID=UPI0005249901|nr:hypothetical protein [Streptomyces virginiae]MCX5274307.1 hypothetical protein [Streptomyces virginiae]
MNLALDLDTVMTVMLVRFALVVAGAAVLLIIAFTITIVLKRNGTLGTVKDQVAPLARSLGERGRTTDARHGGRPGLKRSLLLSLLDHVGRSGNRR